MKLEFFSGTLELSCGKEESFPECLEHIFKYDPRTRNYRARGCDYAAAVIELRMNRIPFTDLAADYAFDGDWTLKEKITPRPHQKDALELWKQAGSKGIAALPTGSGKTILAVLAIAEVKRPTIVLVPTIDLLTQWAGVLEKFLSVPVGMLGGGSRQIEAVTVSTYDSAVLNMEFIGNRFGLLIADECHHLPGPETRLGASMCIAPYRLGLSATPELPEERMAVMKDLLGEIVCQVNIDELEGKVLSPYLVKHWEIPLDPEEYDLYTRARSCYLEFIRRNRIDFRQESGWGRFLALAARSPEGRQAFRAFLDQRRLARGGEAKVRALWEILRRHAGERIIVFTADNSTAYELGRRFMLPVMTHLTRAAERKEFLEKFRDGTYSVLITNRVLNEGVDVPAAAVGIILAGSGSVREHVQRLGRVLRAAPGKKQAVLYELVSAGTSEESVSSRRRSHRAYTR
ncbi:MAG: DEAD/DEAH box helicase [Lentisphaerae bacterium]|nr:DEAD/DEAH box helicase [Lentisphaerota bacterium]